MLPNYSPTSKQQERVYFQSPMKTCPMTPTNACQQKFQRQKSISFNNYHTPTNHLTQGKTQFLFPTNTQQKQSVPTIVVNGPLIVKNTIIESKQHRTEEPTSRNMLRQKREDVQYFDSHMEKRNFDPVHHKEWSGKIPYFQSLRQTLKNPGSKSKQLFDLQKTIYPKGSQTPINQLMRDKIFSEQVDSKNNHHHFLKPSKVANLGCFTVKESLQKNNSNDQTKNSSSKKKHVFQFITGKTHNKNNESAQNSNTFKENIQPKFSSTANSFFNAKKEKKFPTFLTSRIQKKQQKYEQMFKANKQAKKFFLKSPANFERKQESKTPENKKLVNNKHAKSFSVFENLGHLKKRHLNTQTNQKTITQQKARIKTQAFMTPKEPKVVRLKATSFQNNQIKFHENLQIENGKVNKAALKQKARIGSMSLRQSLDKIPLHLKPIKKVQFQAPEKKQKVEISKLINLQNDTQKTSIRSIQIPSEKQNGKKDTILQTRDEKSRKVHNLPAQKNLETVDDIKQALINCNLFSQEDYQGVFQNHKKDILTPNTNKKVQTVKFKIQPNQMKTSLKDLFDSADLSQQRASRLSSQSDQRRLAQLAELCEQKRSKWILEQTDTIKESLKQLSEFNTEKSLYDNQWKKIPTKDFSTSRNNRRSLVCENIDEIREEDGFCISGDSQLESDRLMSENSLDRGHKGSESDRSKFKKNKRKQLQIIIPQINFSQNYQEEQQKLFNVSLDDFQIRWCSEDPILFNNPNIQTQKTFVTYWVKHKLTQTLYTIKKYEKKTIYQLGDTYITNFIKKVKIQMMNISHPNIQKIYAIFDDKTNIYLVCEFTEIKLSQILLRKKQQTLINSSQQCITSAYCVDSQRKRMTLLKQIIDGLQEIHLGHIFHKTLQPSTIGIVMDTCKISGFDSLQFTEQPSNKLCNSYSCPQTLFDSSKSAMDIWCLGILAYELLIGRKPFYEEKDNNSSKTVRKILECNFDIPINKSQLCQQILNLALKRNPKDRGSIFDIKNIWSRKLRQINQQSIKEEFLQSEIMILF